MHYGSSTFLLVLILIHWIFIPKEGIQTSTIQPVLRLGLKFKNFIILLAEGRLVNLGNATGHPSRIMDGSFANQVLAQIFLYEQAFANINDDDKKKELITVKVLPKKLDEEVAELMVQGFGGTITKLTQEQADYIHVPVDGPFKEEEYKY